MAYLDNRLVEILLLEIVETLDECEISKAMESGLTNITNQLNHFGLCPCNLLTDPFDLRCSAREAPYVRFSREAKWLNVV